MNVANYIYSDTKKITHKHEALAQRPDCRF